MNKNGSTTIKDVAERANVSQMTVSRVLNGQSSVKDTTRKRVQSAMRELNYRPNLMARKLAGRRGRFIGLVYRNPSYGYLSEFLIGALNACRELGHYLVVEEPIVDEQISDLELIERRFRDSSIQSLIVVPPLSENPKLIDTLEKTGISFVCIGPPLETYKGPSIKMDEELAAHEMTEFLFGLGHKRIALIKGPADHRASDLRFKGYQSSLSSRGVTALPELIQAGDFTYVSGMKSAAALLAMDSPPDAIFACNDDMAAGAIAAAHRAGLRVPEDITIVGFDDTENASSTWPTLTTVRQPIREMARCAIELLTQTEDRINSSTKTVLLEHKLIVRKSSAPSKSHKDD